MKIDPGSWKAIDIVASRIWAVAGPLVGVFVGAYIANRNQRRSWVADNKRSEYRELLSALYRTSSKMAALWTSRRSAVGLSFEDRGMYDELNREATQVIDDRIFIAKEVEASNIRKMWVEAEYVLQEHAKVGDFSMAVHEILKAIRAGAERVIY